MEEEYLQSLFNDNYKYLYNKEYDGTLLDLKHNKVYRQFKINVLDKILPLEKLSFEDPIIKNFNNNILSDVYKKAWYISVHALNINSDNRTHEQAYKNAVYGILCEYWISDKLNLTRIEYNKPQLYDLLYNDKKIEIKLRSKRMYSNEWLDVGRIYGNNLNELKLRKKVLKEEWDIMILVTIENSEFSIVGCLDKNNYNYSTCLGKHDSSKNKILIPKVYLKPLSVYF